MSDRVGVQVNAVIGKLMEEITRLNMELAMARAALDVLQPKESTNGEHGISPSLIENPTG